MPIFVYPGDFSNALRHHVATNINIYPWPQIFSFSCLGDFKNGFVLYNVFSTLLFFILYYSVDIFPFHFMFLIYYNLSHLHDRILFNNFVSGHFVVFTYSILKMLVRVSLYTQTNTEIEQISRSGIAWSRECMLSKLGKSVGLFSKQLYLFSFQFSLAVCVNAAFPTFLTTLDIKMFYVYTRTRLYDIQPAVAPI